MSNKTPILLILLILIYPFYTIAQSENPMSFKYEYLTKATLPAVAVSTNGEGVVSKLEVTIAYPGTGQVFFSAEPLTMLDSQASARIAVLVASNILGLDYKKYDFMIALKSPSLIIGGPSAGGVMTIGVISALTNRTVDTKVAMTGMIDPDGTIGPVGGIPEKLKAAAEAGYKIFLIPAGQEVVYDEKIIKQATPMGYVTQIQKTPVNVTELGEKLGVKVIQVATIEEAAQYFLHLNLTKNIVFKKIEYSETQKKLFAQWYDNITKEIDDETMLIKEYLTQQNDTQTIENIEQYLNLTSSLMKKANEYYNKNMYYTALSTLFNAAITIEDLYIQVFINGNYTEIQNYISNINKTITEYSDKLSKINITKLSQLEAYITANDRLTQAKQLLDKAIESIIIYKNLLTGEEKTIIQDTQSLALSKWRAYTTELWLEYGQLESPIINQEKMKEITEYFIYYAETVLSYYGSLGMEQSGDYTTLLELYKHAKEKYDAQDYSASLSDAISIIAYATTGIHELYNTELKEITKAVIDKATYYLTITEYKSAISLGYLESAQEYYDRFIKTNDKTLALQSLKLALLSSLYAELTGELSLTNSNTNSVTTETITIETNTTTNTTIQKENEPQKGEHAIELLFIALLIILTILTALYRKEI